MQEQGIVAGGKLAPNRSHAGPGSAFIEGDKLDARRAFQQTEFSTTDDPGDPGAWPGSLNRADDGQRVAAVANGRQPYEADLFRR